MRKNTEISRTLNVVVTTENIGPTTGSSHITQSQLQRTISTGIVIPVCVLCTTHAPDEGARTVIGHGLGYTLELGAGNTRDPFGLFWCPFLDFFQHIFHAVHTLTDEFLVFPAIFKNMPHDTPDQTNVRSRTETHIFISMSRGPCKARVTHNQRRVVLFFRLHQVHQ